MKPERAQRIKELSREAENIKSWMEAGREKRREAGVRATMRDLMAAYNARVDAIKELEAA